MVFEYQIEESMRCDLASSVYGIYAHQASF